MRWELCVATISKIKPRGLFALVVMIIRYCTTQACSLILRCGLVALHLLFNGVLPLLGCHCALAVSRREFQRDQLARTGLAPICELVALALPLVCMRRQGFLVRCVPGLVRTRWPGPTEAQGQGLSRGDGPLVTPRPWTKSWDEMRQDGSVEESLISSPKVATGETNQLSRWKR